VSQKKGFATPQNQMSNPLRPNQNFAGRGGSFGTFGDKIPKNTVGFGAKPQFGSVRRCFECNSPDTPPAALGGCRTLSQPHWESVQHSLAALGEFLTLPQPHWEGVRHSLSRIGRVSDTPPAALVECRTLSQPHWESVQHSLSCIGRVSDTPQPHWESVRHCQKHTRTHARTHARTHTFNGPFSRTTQVNRYQKVIPIWIFKRQLKNFLFSTSIPIEGTHVFCA